MTVFLTSPMSGHFGIDVSRSFDPTGPPPTGLPPLPNGGGGFDPIGWVRGVGGQICPPGTHCVGPSIQGPFGFAACIGTCVQDRPGAALPPGEIGIVQDGIADCPPGSHPEVIPPHLPGGGRVACFPDRAAIDDVLGPPPGQPTQTRNGFCPGDCTYTTSTGQQRRGRINKCSGACEPKRRTTNYGNVKAAKRAARRLDGSIRALRSLEKTASKFVKTKTSSRRKQPAAATCSCRN